MQLKCQKISWILVIQLAIRAKIFVTCEQSDFESKNLIYDFSPLQEEVERCKTDHLMCEEFSTYPSDHIEKLIKEKKIKKEWFQSQEVEKGKLVEMETDSDTPKSLCPCTRRITKPKGRFNEGGEFVYIVQMTVNNVSYHQTIQQETCRRNSSYSEIEESDKNIPLTANNVTFPCHQVLDFHYLIGVNIRGELTKIIETYNSCCMPIYNKK